MRLRIDREAHALVWSVPPGWLALSSASVGGGLVRPRWVANLDVGDRFTRIDLDTYAAERAAGLGLEGPGTTLLTAADVTQVEQAEVDGVQAWATVGVTKPTWPVPAPTRAGAAPASPPTPGTVNIVLAVPRPLTVSALVQAVGTLTEAKAQVLVQAGVPGTGTASDAVVVLCPDAAASPHDAPEPFAGVRSPLGRAIAEGVHRAVGAGLAAHPWPPPATDPAVVW